MTKHKPNHYKYVRVEFLPNNYAWIENKDNLSLHLNDKVIAESTNGRFWKARIITRSNVLPKGLKKGIHISYTANQFPVADHPVQPELPIVPEIVVLKAHIKLLDDVIKQIKEIV